MEPGALRRPAMENAIVGIVAFVDREDFHEFKQTRRWYLLTLARSKPVYVWRGDDRALPRPWPHARCELWVLPTNQSYFYREGPGVIATWATVCYWIQSQRWTDGNWWDIQCFLKSMVLLMQLQAPVDRVSSLAHKVQSIAHLHVRVGRRPRVVRLIAHAFKTEPASARAANSLDECFLRWMATLSPGDAAHWLVIEVWIQSCPVWMGTTLTESGYLNDTPEASSQRLDGQGFQLMTFAPDVFEGNAESDDDPVLWPMTWSDEMLIS